MNISRDRTDSVIDSVLTASRVLVAIAARSLSDIAEEVTLTQYRTLVVLASRGPQNMAGLAEAVGVTPATATRMCDRLVKKKLVKRGKDPKDRRREPLHLEKKGAALFSQIPKMDASSVLVQRLEGMKETRRRELVALLDEFVQDLPGAERRALRPESENAEESIIARAKRGASGVKARKP